MGNADWKTSLPTVVIAGAFGILGTFLGAHVAGLNQARVEEKRLAHEVDARVEASRRAAYIEMNRTLFFFELDLDDAVEFVREAQALDKADPGRSSPEWRKLTRESRIIDERLRRRFRLLTNQAATILFVGSDPARDAAQAAMDAYARLTELTRRQINGEQQVDHAREIKEAADAAQANLLTVVRDELNFED